MVVYLLLTCLTDIFACLRTIRQDHSPRGCFDDTEVCTLVQVSGSHGT